MAKRTITTLVDDIDGGDATASFAFTFAGKSYEIDLNDANAEKFREALAPWIDAARAVAKNGAAPAPARGSRLARNDLAAIRKWAKDNGHDVSNRGRIPGSVIEAYEAAH